MVDVVFVLYNEISVEIECGINVKFFFIGVN